MMLANWAEVHDGLFFILGGGWSVCGPDPVPSSIVTKIELPWDEANRKHVTIFKLIDEDEQPVMMETPMGPRPLELRADFEAGRPPGLKPGTPLDIPLVMNLPPLPLPPDRRLIWRCFINDETHAEWQVGFTTRPVRGQVDAASL